MGRGGGQAAGGILIIGWEKNVVQGNAENAVGKKMVSRETDGVMT